MKLRKKIGIGLGIIGMVSVGLGAGLQAYKEYKKKNEDIEDISFEETPSERLENLENLTTEELNEQIETRKMELEEQTEQMENSNNKLINKKDLVPFALFSVGTVACFGAAYLLCRGDIKEDKDKIEEKLNIEEFETDKEVEKVGDVEKGEEKEEFDFESALSKSTGKLEEIPLKDNTAELLYGKNNMYK